MKKFTKLSLIAFCIFSFSLLSLNIRLDGIAIKQQQLFAQANYVWSDIPQVSSKSSDLKRTMPLKYRSLNLNLNSLRNILQSAPFEFTDRAVSSPLFIELPKPDGSMSKFYVTEYSMMEPGLAAQFPEIKTYNVKGIDDPYAVGKIDVTAFGFHGMILTPNGDYFIDPVSINNGNTEDYLSYFKSDYKDNQSFECLVNEATENSDLFNSYQSDLTGQQLRTYRLACAATGEYTAVFGGTVNLGQAAIVVAINRVNGVYERDFSVRMTLIANNNLLVYTNSATDPYTNNNGSTMLGQNQTNITTVIGTANFDFGHVFSTGGGGVAGLGVICSSTNKARGVTGLPNPVGDPFYIDYVAHEMGHQFGANHTFNSVTSSCGGGNRSSANAYEPGSGTTIMAYAGICGADDLQPNSDDHFHANSVSAIIAYTQTGGGNSCPVTTNTGNTPPTVSVPAGGFTIPINTPFELTGSATDTENPNSLTYCWEEYDLGPSGSPNSPSGNAPIFRSFSPVISPSRTFPKTSDLLNNTQTIGEILPSYTRNLSFRLTVRDNNAGGGGINYNSISFSVSSVAGPFLVTQPNTNVNWNSGSQTVSWNVANTNSAPVNCTNVNIKLSTDGGYTFPITLISGTVNDGSETVNIPGISTTTARIKVESAGNVFFDISNTNFSITAVSAPSEFTVIPEGFYNIETGKLNIRDTVSIYLRNTISPFSLVDSGKVVIDSVNFMGSVIFSNAPTGTYYVIVKNRTTLETWSKSGGESYTQGSPFSYDFTTAVTQAYEDNMVLINGKSCVYSGDIAKNNIIELSDIIKAINKAQVFGNGFVPEDITGDGVVELTDVIIVYNNSSNFVYRKTPPGAP